MDLKRVVGLRVRAARSKAGVTQEGLAELIERTVETVSNVERGQNLPTLDTLDRIAKALNVPVRAFFEGDEGGDNRRRAELEARMTMLLHSLPDADAETAVRLIDVLASAKRRGRK